MNGHLIARTPYAWDLPVWLASGKLDAIELIHHHALRNGVVDNEKDGRPRDKSLFPGPRGNGRWSETVYYHVLNCGLRIPPAAGSGSGFNDSPVGTNRVYVFCGNEFSRRSLVGRPQSGPRVRHQRSAAAADGRRPTARAMCFKLADGGSLTLEIGLNLATSVPVEYLQIIKNGTVEAEVRLAEFKNRKGRLPPIHFDDSGWFLVRAVTSNPKTLPIRLQRPVLRRESRPPARQPRQREVLPRLARRQPRRESASMPDLDESERASLLAEQESARKFFEKLLATANAD